MDMAKREYILALAALIASPALGGDVIVPLAANQYAVQDTSYSTRIWISNPTTGALSFTARFYAAGADGSKAPAASPPITVGPGATLVLTNVTPPGATGMLDVNGGAQLTVTSNLEATRGGQSVGITNAPPFSSADAFAPNTVAQLSGLQRVSGTSVSDLFVFNLDNSAAICSLKVFQAGGAQLAGATLTLQPLQRRDFVDTISGPAGLDITDVRVQASCDHRFFLAGLIRRSAANPVYLPAAATLATSVLGAGGSTPGGGDSVVLSVPGVFLNAVAGNSAKGFQLPAKVGQTYKTAVVEFDMQIRKFPEGLFTGVHALRRDGRRQEAVLYYGLQIVNGNSKTTLDLGVQDVLARGSGPWQEFHTYHLKITYDVPNRQVTLLVSEAGVLKQTLRGQAQHLDLSADTHPLIVDFGQEGIADGAYYPPIGWVYSNLKATLTP